ncbi:PDZ domain-containing protein [Bacillus marasmi]|uniref:PDZ domain-containing protein n=1 Tax=Bacillus marasmi TaxID=1926279 RepID=UPI0011C8A49C|nr:PDZ domain-containing protein [Bacillus marasmi]
MAKDWLIELLFGTGKLFLNPVFYLLFFLAAWLGVSRVKRERRNFHVRVENAYFELRQLLPIGSLIGLCLSVFLVAIGIVIPTEFVVIMASISVIIMLTTKVRFLSPAYTIGIAAIIMIILDWQNISLPFFGEIQLEELTYSAIAILLGLLIMGEGILINWNGKKGTSPMLINGKRGAKVGAHELRRVWMLPAFLVIPGELLKIPLDWWPTFSAGGETYSLLLVPFAIGVHQQVQGRVPQVAIQALGKQVINLGAIVTLLGLASFFLPLAALGVIGVAMITRETLTWKQIMNERNLPFYFSKKNQGMRILGILLDTPASKMGLKVGEVITKVNGQTVADEESFYEALQRNRALCKLEVLDVNNEIRFVQRALYEGDHHKLGILFVQEDKQDEFQTAMGN